MRYLMIHWIDEAVLNAEGTEFESGVGAWTAEMDRRGVRLQGEPLRSVSGAATVRIRGGEVLVSDGPFAETKEQIAGFDLLECASMAEAAEVASRHPTARIGTFELRQIWDGVGQRLWPCGARLLDLAWTDFPAGIIAE